MARPLTSLVGSFPLDPTRDNIARALRDQERLGVDIPVVPQLQDFITAYAEPLKRAGVVHEEGGGLRLATRGLEWVGPLPPWEARVVAEQGYTGKLRLPVTGPYTLASSIALEGRPGNLLYSVLRDHSLTSRMVDYVAEVVRETVRLLRPRMLCIDEPVLSVIVGSRRILLGYTIEELREGLEKVLEEARGVELRCIHVCSRLPPLLKKILLPIENLEVLDHEHHDNPENRAYYTRQELEEHGKKLAYGVVSSKSTHVETVDEVRELLTDALQRYGDLVAIVKPDCGFRGLKGALGGREYEEIVLPKVKTLVEAVKYSTKPP